MADMVNIEQFLTPATFGNGTFLGDDKEILELDSKERVLVSAHHHACPRPEMVIEYYGQAWLSQQPNPSEISPDEIETHGIELTRTRYDQCDFVFGLICEEIARRGSEKQSLLSKLTSSKPRLVSEPISHDGFEAGRVPESHWVQMSPLSTLVGYALPRIFIEEMGRGENQNSERYLQAMDLLDQAIDVAHSPTELLAHLAELFANSQANVVSMLGHIFEPGILKEENNRSEYQMVAGALQHLAPTVWQKYQKLNSFQRTENGILDLEQAKII